MNLLRWSLFALVSLLSGCFTLAPTDTINTTTKAFSDVVITSAQALTVEQKAKPNVRRSEAVMYWIRNGDSNENISSKDTAGSFARLTCAGVASLGKTKAFLDYAGDYSKALEGITTPGGDSFSGQWKKFLENKKEVELKGPKEPSRSIDVFSACTKDVMTQIAFAGASASDTSDEAAVAVSASLEAYKSLFSALEKAATDSLKVVNEIEARKKFSDFVIKEHAAFNAALAQGMGPSTLENSWKRRKAVALWKPYHTFQEIARLNTKTQAREIASLSARMLAEFSEYDALKNTRSPYEITKSLAKAENALFELARNKDLSVSSVLSFLKGLQKELATIKSDFDDVSSKVTALTSAAKE